MLPYQFSCSAYGALAALGSLTFATPSVFSLRSANYVCTLRDKLLNWVLDIYIVGNFEK
jgi:hypothetical protein